MHLLSPIIFKVSSKITYVLQILNHFIDTYLTPYKVCHFACVWYEAEKSKLFDSVAQ